MPCSIDSRVKDRSSCISKSTLNDIATSLNINHTGLNKPQLHAILSRHLGIDESKWSLQLKLPTLRKKITSYFAPTAPQAWRNNPNTWLTNHDIDVVMRRLENRYRSFKYLGTVTRDAMHMDKNGSCISRLYTNITLCNFNLFDLYPKYKKFGIIFNLDVNTGPGYHWTGLYFELSKQNPRIVYSDSVGSKPPTEIHEFILNIRSQALKIFKQIPITINTTTFQHGDTECGIYAMVFIISCLANKKNSDAFAKMCGDVCMSTYRRQLFGGL